MLENRPPIAAEIRRRVLVEAGHRCAIPTCRHIEVDIHHIIPWAQAQAHEYDNLIALCPNCHRRADRGEIDRKALRLYKLNLRFVHDKYSQIEMDMLFELYRLPPNQGIMWPPFIMILLKRILEAGLVQIHKNPQGSALSFGMQLSPDLIMLTPKGKRFLDEIGTVEF
jgi:hypothetical protein